MTTQFEFRLIGASAPDGELEADDLLAIVTSLKEVATRIGRQQTDAERRGRAPRRTQRVANLTIGLAPGSTTVLARRTGAADSLDLALADEVAFDEKFAELVESIARDERPPWVDDALALAAGGLCAALQQTAPEVEFTVGSQLRRSFKTESIHRETWRIVQPELSDEVTFVGRLFAVNLHTHRLQVQDDVGNQVALPNVTDDEAVGRLLGAYVTVTGAPERDDRGRLSRIRDAAVVAAPDPLSGAGVTEPVPVDEILASAPGVEPGGIQGLTVHEADAFLESIGL